LTNHSLESFICLFHAMSKSVNHVAEATSLRTKPFGLSETSLP
jgi:hypothetical protein